MTAVVKRYCILCFLAGFFYLLVPSPGVAAPDTAAVSADTRAPLVLKQAGSIRMRKDRGVLTARGNVIMTYRGYTIRSDTLVYTRVTETVQAGGNVKVVTPKSGAFVGSYFEMTLPTNEVSGRGIRARSKPWYINGRQMEGDADTMIHVPEGRFTTCNLRTPHYTFRTNDLYLYPGHSIVGYHTTLNVGGVPLLYLPYFYVDLRNLLGRWEIKPGYGSQDGVSLEVNYRYLIESDSGPYTSTLYTDMRQRGGVGAGFDVGYSQPNQHAYFYLFGAQRRPTVINDAGESVRADTEQTIWETRADVNYRFDDSKWKLHGNADWSKNNRFDRDFRGTLGGRGRPRRSFEGSLVRSGANSLFRVDAIREEKAVERDSDVVFVQEQSVLPRIRYQLYSVDVPALGRGVYYSLNSNLENSTDADTGDERWDLSVNQTLTKALAVTSRLGQSYQFGYEQSYVERQTRGAGTDFRSLSAGSFGLLNSYRLTNQSSLTLDYSIEKQLNQEQFVAFSLQGDSLGTARNGLRTHELGLSLQWRNQLTAGALRTGYDFRNSRTRTVLGDSRILSPQFSLQASLTPRLEMDHYLRYSWKDRHIQQANLEFDFDVARDFSLSLGGDYNRRTGSDVLKLKNQFNWRSNNNQWGLRGDIVYDNPSSELEETKFMLYKRLHMWEMRVFFRQIEDRERQVWVSFNLLQYPTKAFGLEADIDNQDFDVEQGNWREMGG